MSGPRLSHEDRILWSKVARTATPLHGKQHPSLPVEPQPDPGSEQIDLELALPAPQRPAAQSDQGRPRRLDMPTRKKLSKGRLPIEARIDLHGLNQAEAHGLLLSFLHRAFAGGVRHILIITGKGSSFGSDGILQRTVPVWLTTTPFRALVSGYETAGRVHGGAGALYVRLRRPQTARRP